MPRQRYSPDDLAAIMASLGYGTAQPQTYRPRPGPTLPQGEEQQVPWQIQPPLDPGTTPPRLSVPSLPPEILAQLYLNHLAQLAVTPAQIDPDYYLRQRHRRSLVQPILAPRENYAEDFPVA